MQMRNRLLKFGFGVVFTFLVNFSQSSGATIVSNLSDAVAGTGTVFASGPPQFYAQEFTTGAQSATLGSVIAALGGAAQPFTASAALLANNGNSPGSTVLTTFNVPAISSAYSDLTFTPASSITLSANTSYWFELMASGTGDYKWQYTDTVSASISDYAYSHDNGSTWTVETNGPFLIEVDSPSSASAPEPSSLILVGLTTLLGCVVVVSRRSRMVGR
jgi:hypothetical protein